jgi:hypothetical protein
VDVYRHALDAIDASHFMAEDKPQETAEALLTQL